MPALDDGPAITLQRMQQRVGPDNERETHTLKLYRLLLDPGLSIDLVVGRSLARSPPFREGVEAETISCQHILSACVGSGRVRWADLTPVQEADDG